MLKLSIEEIIQKIQQEETFEAVSDDYSFTIKIDEYEIGRASCRERV